MAGQLGRCLLSFHSASPPCTHPAGARWTPQPTSTHSCCSAATPPRCPSSSPSRRGALDPKAHYKKLDGTKFPKYFQMGTVVEGAADYYSGKGLGVALWGE